MISKENEYKTILDVSSSYIGKVQLIYILILFYILIIILSIDDTGLLLQNSSIILPIFSIKMNILYFRTISPLIIFAVHLYFLIHHFQHSKKLYQWYRISNSKYDIKTDPYFFNYFVYIKKSNLLNNLFLLVAWIVNVFLPLIILLLIQIKFSKYQILGFTIYHCIFLFLDIFIVIYLWFRSLKPEFTDIYYDKFTKLLNWKFISFVFLNSSGMMIIYFLCFVSLLNFKYVFDVSNDYHYNLVIFKAISPYLDIKNADIILNKPSNEILNGFLLNGQSIEEAELEFTNGVILSNTNLKYATFTNCNFRKADFTNADLTGVLFEYCNLSGANFNKTRMVNTDFRNCILKDAFLILENSKNVQFRDCIFDGCLSFSHVLKNKNRDSNIGTSYLGAYIFNYYDSLKLPYCDLRGMILLPSSDHDSIGYNNSKFYHSDLSGMTFEKIKMKKCDFSHCKLLGVNFRNSDLSYSLFDSTILDGADFSGARLEGTSFIGAKVFGEEIITKDTNIIRIILNRCCTKRDTILKDLLTENVHIAEGVIFINFLENDKYRQIMKFIKSNDKNLFQSIIQRNKIFKSIFDIRNRYGSFGSLD